MQYLLRQKFVDPVLMEKLRAITRPIIEDNHWGDTFWGVCGGVGENHLGRLLEEIRG